ncbi:hypothetical protein L484_004232 [Morus notabilis]|uniref:Uncharacterized protein n=1 Tax=Morus notabilis TaxID=981085 RepID=W9RGS1_9ROSA|nr:hypothetical protein L484_004232 [Morus notabilis]
MQISSTAAKGRVVSSPRSQRSTTLNRRAPTKGDAGIFVHERYLESQRSQSGERAKVGISRRNRRCGARGMKGDLCVDVGGKIREKEANTGE